MAYDSANSECYFAADIYPKQRNRATGVEGVFFQGYSSDESGSYDQYDLVLKYKCANYKTANVAALQAIWNPST